VNNRIWLLSAQPFAFANSVTASYYSRTETQPTAGMLFIETCEIPLK